MSAQTTSAHASTEKEAMQAECARLSSRRPSIVDGSWSSRDTYRLVLLGAGGVGKTSLVARHVLGEFIDIYQPTLEDAYRLVVQLPDGLFQSIEIVDTAGYHQFPAMQHLSIQSGNAFFVVFDISNRQSFDQAKHLMHLISCSKGDRDTPMILVGNKRDLSDNRKVSSQETSDVIAEFEDCRYIETSAKENVNIEHVFSEIIARSFASSTKDIDLSKKSNRSKTLLSRYRRSSKAESLRKNSTGSDQGEPSPACAIL